MSPKEAIQSLRDQFNNRAAMLQRDLDEMNARLALLVELEANVDAAQAQIDAMPQALIDAEKKGYDQRMSEEGTLNGPDKVFSNEEFEAELALRLAPVQAKIDELSGQLEAVGASVAAAEADKAALQAQVDAFPAAKDAAVVEAVQAVKVAVAAKIRDASVDDLAIAAELEA
jgi:hypothetical protein